MSTTRIPILSGPRIDEWADAWKYAFDRTKDIFVRVRVHDENGTMTGFQQPIMCIQVRGLSHTGSSGYEIEFRGPMFLAPQEGEVVNRRRRWPAKGLFNTQTRDGHIELVES
jgi:hypothetical protein